jgi:glycosyltransferase involved in cell wall biosynthesis
LKQNKIYVLQLGMTKNIGGMETYLMTQYRILNKNIKYDFINLTGEFPIAFNEEIKRNNSKIYAVPTRKINPLLHYYEIMKILIKNKNKYDFIVLNTCNLYYIFPLFFAKFVGIPNRIIHSHNSNDEIKISFFRKILININKILMNFSVTDYWACSNIAGKWMFDNKSFKVIHNAIKVSDFVYNEEIRRKIRKKFNILEEKFIVGHVGRFSYQKNHKYLIKIFYEINKLMPNAELLLVGDAVNDKKYLNDAKETVKILKLEKKVKFLGMRNDVAELMQAMDCFVMPSRFEGLPVVGIEAQTAGLPCFFSDTITEELYITDLANYISLKESPIVWAKKIIESKNKLRKNMLNEIRAKGYDINVEIKKLENFYLKRKRE